MKYKLIKEYPGSPKLGTIVGDYNSNGFKDLNGGFPIMRISCFLVQNQPEFWQEIAEKDYEILFFIDDLNIITNNIGEQYEKNCLESKDVNIYSIKRLSDNQIFSVGDVDNFGKITAFVIRENKIVSQYYKMGDWQWLSSIKHIKQPLFTTEDDVDIFKGDSYCKVNNHSDYSLVTGFVAYGGHDDYRGLRFSTKEKAEEYIIMNKTCLSINDLKPWGDLLMKEVLKLVKSKIKS